jgi:hypothetical protein
VAARAGAGPHRVGRHGRRGVALETEAMGWSGDLVYVDMRRTDYGVNACWLRATDVKRREIIPF